MLCTPGCSSQEPAPSEKTTADGYKASLRPGRQAQCHGDSSATSRGGERASHGSCMAPPSTPGMRVCAHCPGSFQKPSPGDSHTAGRQENQAGSPVKGAVSLLPHPDSAHSPLPGFVNAVLLKHSSAAHLRGVCGCSPVAETGQKKQPSPLWPLTGTGCRHRPPAEPPP